MIYRVYHLKDVDSNTVEDILRRVNDCKSALIPHGHSSFGVFTGVLGLATNEVYWVLMSAEGAADPAALLEAAGLRIHALKTLVPTVRPLEHMERTQAGLFVFRWFSVRNRDVDEIVDISNQAWESFEAGFDSQIQGLFAEQDRSAEHGTMLLVTWYRNLSVWEDSRQPDPAARALFARRHALTLEQTPIATRLHITR